MKTPLQELIERLEKKIDVCNKNNLEREAMGMIEAKAIATELIENTLQDNGLIEAAFDEVRRLHPYKESGNRESYSQYNEGWQDAIDSLAVRLNSKNH